jgi:hypothetical protein
MATEKQPIRLSPEAVYDRRSELVKDMVAKESAANDAKTARLKALRLAKEAAEPAPAPATKRKAKSRKPG